MILFLCSKSSSLNTEISMFLWTTITEMVSSSEQESSVVHINRYQGDLCGLWPRWRGQLILLAPSLSKSGFFCLIIPVRSIAQFHIETSNSNQISRRDGKIIQKHSWKSFIQSKNMAHLIFKVKILRRWSKENTDDDESVEKVALLQTDEAKD